MKPSTRARRCIIGVLALGGPTMLATELEVQRIALQCSERSWEIARAGLAKEKILTRSVRGQRGPITWRMHDHVIAKREKLHAIRFVTELRAQIAGTEPPPPPRIPSKYRYGSRKYLRAHYSQPSLDIATIARELETGSAQIDGEIASHEAAQRQPASESDWLKPPKYHGCEAALDDGFGHCRRCQVASHRHKRQWSPQWQEQVEQRNEALRRERMQDAYDTIGRSDGPGALGFNVSHRDD